MFGFEMLVASGPQAEQVTSAFYRCLGRLEGADAADGEAYMRTQHLGSDQLITIRLWSAEALDAFRAELCG